MGQQPSAEESLHGGGMECVVPPGTFHPEIQGAVEEILAEYTPGFTVKDLHTMTLVNSIRERLDSLTDPQDGSNILHDVVEHRSANEDEFLALLKRILELGANPDLPHEGKNDHRPSHLCCIRGLTKLAPTIFMCRPDMNAGDFEGRVPMTVASCEVDGDGQFPERAPLRQLVRKMLQEISVGDGSGEYKFPSLAELACRREWFAVKNLVRRRIVSEQEYCEEFGGKTAFEWADYYKKMNIAAELAFYARITRVDVSPRAELDVSPVQEKADSAPTETFSHNETLICVVCMEKQRNCILLPCKHLHTCMDCAAALPNCPICQGAITTRERVYM